jgi:hypothetical protein
MIYVVLYLLEEESVETIHYSIHHSATIGETVIQVHRLEVPARKAKEQNLAVYRGRAFIE